MWKKKSAANRQADLLRNELKSSLGIEHLYALRIFIRYDLTGLTDAEYEQVKKTVLSEPQTDIGYEEELPEGSGDFLLAVSFCPVSMIKGPIPRRNAFKSLPAAKNRWCGRPLCTPQAAT